MDTIKFLREMPNCIFDASGHEHYLILKLEQKMPSMTYISISSAHLTKFSSLEFHAILVWFLSTESLSRRYIEYFFNVFKINSYKIHFSTEIKTCTEKLQNLVTFLNYFNSRLIWRPYV